MKVIYLISAAVILLGLSCCRSENNGTFIPEEREVEITILTAKESTRAVPDKGSEKERQIDELDLLIFKNNQYQYSRRAFKISPGLYKANLKADNATLVAYVFANCRTYLENWETSTDQTGKSWEAILKEFVETNPSQWVSDPPRALPMWGRTSGTVTETQVNGWNPVLLLRSVASADVYVVQNDQTSKFVLTDAHLYYAPNKGYYAPEPDGTGYKVVCPPDMQTTLNSLKGSGVVLSVEPDGTGGTIEKQKIASQLYMFDNDTDASMISATRRHTRLIVAGYYDQPEPPGPVDDREKTYYPLDFVKEDGVFSKIVRNYKYVFGITKVTGPGYATLEEAADEYPVNMNVDVIDWNLDDMHIGVQGKYYLSLERKYARLWRDAGSTDTQTLTYEILDSTPGASFTINFTTDGNGPQSNSPLLNEIWNDYFKVTLNHDASTKSAKLIVEALRNHTVGYDTDVLEIRFRDLVFHIQITQHPYTEEDWLDGGEIPTDL